MLPSFYKMLPMDTQPVTASQHSSSSSIQKTEHSSSPCFFPSHHGLQAEFQEGRQHRGKHARCAKAEPVPDEEMLPEVNLT